MPPPTRLSHQKATGTTESFFFSEAIHCTRNRAVKANWPRKPILTQGDMPQSTCHRSEKRREASDIVQTSWPTPCRAGETRGGQGQGASAKDEDEATWYRTGRRSSQATPNRSTTTRS